MIIGYKQFFHQSSYKKERKVEKTIKSKNIFPDVQRKHLIL